MAYRIDTLGRRRHKREAFINSKGYMLIYRPSHPCAMYHGYVYEHRLVVEEKIGRFLKIDEEVHHKDDDRLNNHPDNLEIVSEKDHQRLHKGWKKIDGQWFKTCGSCKRGLRVEGNFYRLSTWDKHDYKCNEYASICKHCYSIRARRYRVK